MNAKEEIAALTIQVTRATTVEKSAETLIGGFQQRLTDAIAAATANGATAEELQPLSDLGAALDAESDALQAAIAANTTAAQATPPA